MSSSSSDPTDEGNGEKHILWTNEGPGSALRDFFSTSALSTLSLRKTARKVGTSTPSKIFLDFVGREFARAMLMGVMSRVIGSDSILRRESLDVRLRFLGASARGYRSMIPPTVAKKKKPLYVRSRFLRCTCEVNGGDLAGE
jgi:hypothetical protein